MGVTSGRLRCLGVAPRRDPGHPLVRDGAVLACAQRGGAGRNTMALMVLILGEKNTTFDEESIPPHKKRFVLSLRKWGGALNHYH